VSETQGSENKGLIGEIVEGIRSIEQKVEHLIHPEQGNGTAGQDSSSASSTESQSGSAQGGDAGNVVAANAANLTASEGSVTGATSQTQTDPEAAIACQSEDWQAASGSASQSSSAVTGEAAVGGDTGEGSASATISASNTEAASSSGALTESTVEAGKAGASNTVVDAVDVSQSSANAASSSASAETSNAAAAAFESLAEQVRDSVHTLRKFLWTFDASAVGHLHAELDKLEKLV
jgi:hypothetical protein